MEAFLLATATPQVTAVLSEALTVQAQKAYAL